MDAAIIVPTDFLSDFTARRPIHMALAHRVLADEAYAKFYKDCQRGFKEYDLNVSSQKRTKTFVILDNSLMENGHVALTFRQLIDAARVIRANEIILPDAFCDFEANNELLAESYNTVRTYDKVNPVSATSTTRMRIAGVVQGSTPEQLIASYELMARTVDTICIPKVIDTIWPEDGRYGFIRELDTRKLLGRVGTRSARQKRVMLHLLGVWSHPIEVYYVEKQWPGLFRSVDSALPFHAGLAEHRIHNLYGLTVKNNDGTETTYTKAKRPDNYLDIRQVDLSENQFYTITYNMHIFDGYAQGLDHGSNSTFARIGETISSAAKARPGVFESDPKLRQQ